MNVVCILDNGFEELEALGTIDILRRGNIHVDIISIKNEESVIGSHGIEIKNMKYHGLSYVKKEIVLK